MLLDGMHLPLTTPFLPDGRLNLRKLEDNVRRYSKTPTAGIAALACSGQPSLLSDIETREVLRVVAETAVVEKVLTAGVRRDSVIGSLELIAHAADIGFDVALVPIPSLLRGDRALKEILTFFSAIADVAELPVVLDSGSGDSEISLEVAIELAGHPNIIGILDTSGDTSRLSDVLKGTAAVQREVTVTPVFAAVTRRMLHIASNPATELISVEMLAGGGTAQALTSAATRPALKTRQRSAGFQVLCGRTAAMLSALQTGAVGAAPALAAAAPQACYEVVAAWKDGDPALAAEKQDRLQMLAKQVEEELGVAGIKYGCDLNGYFGGRPRLPTLPLTGAQREAIGHLMAGIRN